MADEWDLTPGRTGKRTIDQIMAKSDSKSSTGDSEGSSEANGSTANVKTSTKKKKVAPNYSKTYKKYTIPVPSEVYVEPEAYSLARVGLELYETDEENYTPYVPTGNVVGTTTVEDDSIDNDDENLVGFELHLGKVLKTYYHGDCNSISFESSYKDMTDSGSLKVDTIDLKKSYKGVRVKLLSEWEKYGEHLKWEDLEQCLLGFITEQAFTDTETEITLGGMTKTLEMKYKFEFQQMLRSEIINQVILTAGLKPCINVDGLEDDITDFKNYSEGDGEDSDVPGIGDAKIDDLVSKWCKGKKTQLAKAKAIHEGLRDEVGIWYKHYYDSKYHTPEECLKHHKDGLNCGDCSILTVACMKAGGLNAYTTFRCDHAHYFTTIVIDGKKYYSDLVWSEGQRSKRPWNETWEGNTCGSKYNLT